MGNNPNPETASQNQSNRYVTEQLGEKVTSEEYFRADRKGWNIMEKKIKQ